MHHRNFNINILSLCCLHCVSITFFWIICIVFLFFTLLYFTLLYFTVHYRDYDLFYSCLFSTILLVSFFIFYHQLIFLFIYFLIFSFIRKCTSSFFIWVFNHTFITTSWIHEISEVIVFFWTYFLAYSHSFFYLLCIFSRIKSHFHFNFFASYTHSYSYFSGYYFFIHFQLFFKAYKNALFNKWVMTWQQQQQHTQLQNYTLHW